MAISNIIHACNDSKTNQNCGQYHTQTETRCVNNLPAIKKGEEHSAVYQRKPKTKATLPGVLHPVKRWRSCVCESPDVSFVKEWKLSVVHFVYFVIFCFTEMHVSECLLYLYFHQCHGSLLRVSIDLLIILIYLYCIF